MSRFTRRGFLQRASVGMAAVGGIVALPRLLAPSDTASAARRAPASSTSVQPSLTDAAAHEPLVAYVRDWAKGEVSVFIGKREVTVRDPELVARLLKAGA